MITEISKAFSVTNFVDQVGFRFNVTFQNNEHVQIASPVEIREPYTRT